MSQYSPSSRSASGIILKKINNLLRKFLRFSVCLSLSGQLSLLPCLQFSKAHLHWVNGTIVAHAHASKGLGNKNSARKSPFANHKHTLVEMFLLWGAEKTRGIPSVEDYAVIFITCEIDSAPQPKEIQDEIFAIFLSGRSPPATRTV